MKITYRKLMHVACGQSLALERLEAYLKIFDSYIDKYENTDKFNAENVRGFLKSFKKEVFFIFITNYYNRGIISRREKKT